MSNETREWKGNDKQKDISRWYESIDQNKRINGENVTERLLSMQGKHRKQGVTADVNIKVNSLNDFSNTNLDFLNNSYFEPFVDEIITKIIGFNVDTGELDYIEPVTIKKYKIIKRVKGKEIEYWRGKSVKYTDDETNFLKEYTSQIKDKSITAKEVANRFNSAFMQRGFLARNQGSITNKIKILKLRS